ncbi:conserved Plasmodium protein, unknown function [Plasmodium malariae]|uniref:Uncharacterized protein n=1 Tax=Plasmodium malariae TaxID=5858 RepID=A0A1A8W6P9_PLAMA|nr:conserved Plasmodium protein, unknown function [Plasmodium malariae]
MLSKQLHDLRIQKQVQIFEDKHIDKLTRNKYRLFRNIYKSIIVSPLHLVSIKKVLENLISINKSFEEFENLFYVEEQNTVHCFYDENEKREIEIYLKHREFLTVEEEKIIFKKIKEFLKLCSLYSNKNEVKILIEFLIYKYEINVKCSQDILLCILPNIFLVELKNILEIIYIEGTSPFFFINNFKHDQLKNVDKSVFLQHIKRNNAIYKILFEYLIELIFSSSCDNAIVRKKETHIPYINFFITITEDIVNSFIDMPIYIVEFYCNVLLVLISNSKKVFDLLGKKICSAIKVNEMNSMNSLVQEKENIFLLQIQNCCQFLEKFLKIFDVAMFKCKKEFDLSFLKNKIFLFINYDFLSLHENRIRENSLCSCFVKCLIVLLNIIYKNTYKISFSSYFKETQGDLQYSDNTMEQLEQQQQQQQRQRSDEKHIMNIINFVKENKKNCFDSRLDAIIEDGKMLVKLLQIFYELNDAYEVIDNLIKIILIKSYSMKLNLDRLDLIFSLLQNKENYKFTIIFIVNLISFYIYLIRREAHKKSDKEGTEGITGTVGTADMEEAIEEMKLEHVDTLELLLRKYCFSNTLNNSVVYRTHFYEIVKYFICENSELFKKKILLFEVYSKIDEHLLKLINMFSNKLNIVKIFNHVNEEKVDIGDPEIVEQALKSIKFIYNYRLRAKKKKNSNEEQIVEGREKETQRERRTGEQCCEQSQKIIQETSSQQSQRGNQTKDIFVKDFLPLGFIEKGIQNIEKSKGFLECLYARVVYLLKENKMLFTDYVQKYKIELISLFPSKKYLYRIIFDAFKELKLHNFCEMDKNRNKIFLKFYIQLFMIKLIKMHNKNKEKLKKDKFFKNFININFSFFFIIYDCENNKDLYISNSFFSRDIVHGIFQLTKNFFFLLCKLKNVSCYNFDDFIQMQMKQQRYKTIENFVKHSVPFRTNILIRILYFFSNVDLFKCFGSCNTELNTTRYEAHEVDEGELNQINENILTVSTKVSLDNESNDDYEICKEKEIKQHVEKKKLRNFLLRIFKILFVNMDNKNFSYYAYTSKKMYMSVVESFQKTIVQFNNIDPSVTYFLYFKCLNLFYMNSTYLKFVCDTLDYFIFLYNVDNIKKYIKDINMMTNAAIEIYKYLKKRTRKLDIKNYYGNCFMGIIILCTPYVFSSTRIRYVINKAKKINDKKRVVIDYHILNTLFDRSRIMKNAGIFHLLDNVESCPSYPENYITDGIRRNKVVNEANFVDDNNSASNTVNNSNDISNSVNNSNDISNIISNSNNSSSNSKEEKGVCLMTGDNNKNEVIGNIEDSLEPLCNEYTVHVHSLIYGRKWDRRKPQCYEVIKYILFIFAYLNKYFFNVLLSNFHVDIFYNSIAVYFLKKNLILIHLRRIMQRNSYPYKITKIYKLILSMNWKLFYKYEYIYPFLYLIDFYVNVLDSSYLRKAKVERLNDSNIGASNTNAKSIMNNGLNYGGPVIERSSIKSAENKKLNEKVKYMNRKLLKEFSLHYSSKTSKKPINIIKLRKMKRIKYSAILNNPNIEEMDKKFFQNLRGFFKYHEQLIEHFYFDKESEIRAMCELIIKRIIEYNNDILIIQLLSIKNFCTSSLFKKDIRSCIEKLDIYNFMLFKELFSNKKDHNYNSILLMCKNVKSVAEKNKLLLFIETHVVKKKTKGSLRCLSILKILIMLSDNNINISSDNNSLNNIHHYVEFVKNHIKIFKRISVFIETNNILFLKIIKYITNICTLMCNVPELITYHLSLVKNNFLSDIVSLFSKNIYFFYEDISSHMKSLSYAFNKLIKKKIRLFVDSQRKQYLKGASTLEGVSSLDEASTVAEISTIIEASTMADASTVLEDADKEKQTKSQLTDGKKRQNEQICSPKDECSIREVSLKKRKLTNYNSLSHCSVSEDETLRTLIVHKKKKGNRCYMEHFVQNEGEADMISHYHLHIFAFICTFINRIFRNEIIDLQYFIVLMKNLMFLFNKNYSSYVISICFINFIIKIKIEDLHACTHYITDVLNIYYSHDITYCISNHLLLFLSLYLCPHSFVKDKLVQNDQVNKLKKRGKVNTSYNDNTIGYVEHFGSINKENYNSELENNKRIGIINRTTSYPAYVQTKLKYIKPHLKKVKNMKLLCLKIISLISIINSSNKSSIKLISYFIYFSTFQNFILCFCFAKDKVINKRLNILFKKFAFRNTDTFILAHILSNFKVSARASCNLCNYLREKGMGDQEEKEEEEQVEVKVDVAAGISGQRSVERPKNNKQNDVHYFENLFLYKFLFYLNKQKEYMAFNEGYKKYMKHKENLESTNQGAVNDLDNSHFAYNIFNDILNMEIENNGDDVDSGRSTNNNRGSCKVSDIINRKLLTFYDFIVNKLLNINYAVGSRLFNEIIVFINQRINNHIDAKHIFDAIMYSLYNQKNKKSFSILNEIYIHNIFNKALFKIKLDNSMQILIVSKINEILRNLFEKYYLVFGNEMNERKKRYESVEEEYYGEDTEEENCDDSSRENSRTNSTTNSSNIKKGKKKKSLYSEMDKIYEEYKKYTAHVGTINEITTSDEKDYNCTLAYTGAFSSNLFDINSSGSKVNINDNNCINNYEEEDNGYMKNIVEYEYGSGEILYIKDTNRCKDLNKIFFIDSYYLNTILKCICSLLINFPLFTKKRMIELFCALFLNNKRYILMNEKNLLKSNFYNFSKDKKVKHINKIVINPLKKLSIYHLFFIFSNNDIKSCLENITNYYQKNSNLFENPTRIYDHNGSLVLNNSLFIYQHLLVFAHFFGASYNIISDLGLKLLFLLINCYISNCYKYIASLYEKHQGKIMNLNSHDFCCYSVKYDVSNHIGNKTQDEMLIDLRVEEQNIVTSLLYTSSKIKLTCLQDLFSRLVSCFERKIFESNASNILECYKTVYERRIYFIYFYRLYQNFGSILSNRSKYLLDLLNNIKLTLIACQKNSECIYEGSKFRITGNNSGSWNNNNDSSLLRNEAEERKDENYGRNRENKEDEEDEKFPKFTNDVEDNVERKNRKNVLKNKWYWFDLGYCALICLYEILKNEKKNQTNITPVFYEICLDHVIDCFNFFVYLPRVHVNYDVQNNVNEDIIRNSEHIDMKKTSIILLDILKLILFELYSLYLNDPSKIQIMTMRLSIKNDNNNASTKITIAIILTLKYIYETIGYKELFFSLQDLYQIFSELNDHPDDEIELISKKWFNEISKYTGRT